MSNTHDGTIDFKRLQELTGYDRPSDIARDLREQGIRYRRNRKRVWTTIQAINASMGLESDENNQGEYSPDIL